MVVVMENVEARMGSLLALEIAELTKYATCFLVQRKMENLGVISNMRSYSFFEYVM